ncbi:hypothetical protein FRC02_004037 [Tulasnella sp. 418]|nr:hypothetical protein FRC02_004037 [Tulasnella sp. 418]
MSARLAQITSRYIYSASSRRIATYHRNSGFKSFSRGSPLSRTHGAFGSRLFSSSSSSRATEDDAMQKFVESFKNSPAMAKLMESPSAMQALKEMSDLLAESGVDMHSKPSFATLMRLTARSDFREAAKKVMVEFEKAGVKIDPQNAMQILTGGGMPNK